jgi:hypothetical protein
MSTPNGKVRLLSVAKLSPDVREILKDLAGTRLAILGGEVVAGLPPDFPKAAAAVLAGSEMDGWVTVPDERQAAEELARSGNESELLRDGNPWQRGKAWNLTKQQAIKRANPELAARLIQDATR